MQIDNYKIEFNDETKEFPLHLNSTAIREPGIYCQRRARVETPITNINEYASNSCILFKFDSTDFLDPYSLFFCLDVINPNDNEIQLDHSAHSLIEKIEVINANTNEPIEVIDNYAVETALYFDLKLTQEERIKRRADEGFGDNCYGTNEVTIPAKTVFNESAANIINFNQNLPFPNDVVRSDELTVLMSGGFPNSNENLINLENWAFVKNGKIVPMPTTKNYESNIQSFKIPLMLKTMGQAIQKDNFKFVPLSVFGGPILIKIYINQYAFFVPYKIQKLDYINEEFDKMESNLLNIKDPKINFIVKNTILQYEILEYSSNVKQQLLSQVSANQWKVDYKGLASTQVFYLQNFPSVDINSSFKDKTQIRALYLVITTDLYKKTPYARRLARHNRGFSKIEFKFKNNIIPNVIAEHNSLNTHGEKNCAYFYDQYIKSTDNLCGSVVSYKSFCLNSSLSESIALFHYSSIINKKTVAFKELVTFTDSVWFDAYKMHSKLLYVYNNSLPRGNEYKKICEYDKFQGNLEEYACKTLFCVNFDNMPYSSDAYRNGLQVAPHDMFKLTLHRIPDFAEGDFFARFQNLYTFVTIYVEYYETATLHSNGRFSYV